MKTRGYLTTVYRAFDDEGRSRGVVHTYAYSPDDETMDIAMDRRGIAVYQHQTKCGFTGVQTLRISNEVYRGDEMLVNRVLLEKYSPLDTFVTREVRHYQSRPTLRNLDVLAAVLRDELSDIRVDMVMANLGRVDHG